MKSIRSRRLRAEQPCVIARSFAAMRRAVCETLEERRLLADTGTGLVGNYYSDGNFQNLALARTDPQINFDWGTGSADPGIPAEGFSVRWTGQITAPAGGVYTLSAESAGGILVIVGGQTVINDLSFHAQRTSSGSFNFAQGQFYDIRIDFVDQGDAVAKLRWTGGSFADALVPQQQLYRLGTNWISDWSSTTIGVGDSGGFFNGSGDDFTIGTGTTTSPPPTSPPPTSPPPTSPPPTSPPPTSPPPTVPPSGGLNVNFQPDDAPTVEGYVIDAGQTYGARNGQVYGWTASNTGNAVDRNINSDQLLDTNLAVNMGSRWELAVPNGSYSVKVGVGDAASSSTNNVWIEGVNLFNYQPLAANTFASKSIAVNVSDGKLTLGIGSANSGLVKLNYVEVTGAGISPPTSPPPTSPPPTSPPPPPPPPPPGGLNVNFQPAGAPTVSGYVVDAGATYGSRNGQTYGWTTGHTDTVVDRNINADQLRDTNVGVKKAARWELAVPNGSYTVTVGVGDAASSSTNNVWIEGVNLFNYQSLPANIFNTKSITVNVSDGKLTMGIGSANSGLVKINYIQVGGAGISSSLSVLSAESSAGTLAMAASTPPALGPVYNGEVAGPTLLSSAPANARLIAAVANASATSGAKFAYKIVRDDSEVMARLSGLTSGSTADVTFRSSLEEDSAFVAVSVTDGQAVLQWRTTDGGAIQSSTARSVGASVWLKVKRDSNFFAGYISSSGVDGSWQIIGTAGVKMGVFAHAGLAIAGPLSDNEAAFSDVGVRIRPELGGNLHPVADFRYDRPFVDMVKLTAGFKKLDGSAAPTDSGGWPTSSDFTTMLAGNGNIPSGRYTVTFTGPSGATVSSMGGGTSVSFGSYNATTRTHIWYANVSAGASALGLRFQNTVSGVNDLRVLQPGYSITNTPTYADAYLNKLRDLDPAALRFMDWHEINDNTQTSWSQRGTMSSPNWVHAGVAWEAAIELCNILGANMYVNVPARADDNYMRQLATLIRNNLRADLAIYLEIGNELWATNFTNTPWNAEQALKEVQDAKRAGGQSDLNYDNLPVDLNQTDKYAGNATTWALRRTARRGKELSDIFKEVWTQAGLTDPINTRIRPVLAAQVSRSVSYTTMTDYLSAVHGPPGNYFYSMAGAVYFQMWPYNDSFVNGQWTSPSTTLTKDQVLDAMAGSAGRYSSENRFSNSWNTVRDLGMQLMEYEGGHDTFGPLNVQAKKEATLDPRMKTIMQGYLSTFFQQGGSSFMYFTLGSQSYDQPYGTWAISNNANDWNLPKAQAFKEVRSGNLPDARPSAGVFG